MATSRPADDQTTSRRLADDLTVLEEVVYQLRLISPPARRHVTRWIRARKNGDWASISIETDGTTHLSVRPPGAK